MLRILIVRPGSTDFDEQRRIKGCLNIPLSERGRHQVAQVVTELSDEAIRVVYSGPCQSAVETAGVLAQAHQAQVKELADLQNLNHGLWHGKLIEEVRKGQPKVYRQWQDHPETVCPPEGETWQSAKRRARKVLQKIARKHATGTVAVVANEPLASLLTCLLNDTCMQDVWQAECDCGGWESVEVEPSQVLAVR